MNNKTRFLLAFISASLVIPSIASAQFRNPFEDLEEITKTVEETLSGETTRDDEDSATPDGSDMIAILGGAACADAVAGSGTAAQIGAAFLCSTTIQALSKQLTQPELAEVEATTEETFETGEDSTWSNDRGIRVRNTIVAEGTRVETVALEMDELDTSIETDEAAILYSSPNEESDLLALLPAKSYVKVVGRLKGADWYSVQNSDGVSGFVQSGSIESQVGASASAATAEYSAKELTVIYEAPSTSSKLLAAVRPGETLMVSGAVDSGEWLRVQTAGHPGGYVPAASMEAVGSTAGSAEPTPTVADTTTAADAAGAATAAAAPATTEVEMSMRCRTLERTVTLSGG